MPVDHRDRVRTAKSSPHMGHERTRSPQGHAHVIRNANWKGPEAKLSQKWNRCRDS